MSRPICAAVGHELELGRLHELELLRVVPEEAEVVDRVAIDRDEVDFLLIEEHGLRAHGSRRHDVPVREDQPALARRRRSPSPGSTVALGVERARAIDLDGDDAGRDALERAVPGLLLRRERRRPTRAQQRRSSTPADHDV